MPTRPELFVRDAAGIPLPPADIARALAVLDAHLGLKYLSAEWAITWAWPVSDPRWERVRSQEISADWAWDIVGYLPLDCSIDEAPAYLERSLRTYPREEVSRLRDGIGAWNTVTQPTAMVDAVMASTVEEAGKMDAITSGVFATTVAAPSTRKPGRPRKVVVG